MLIVIILAIIGFSLFCYNVSLLIKCENYRQKAEYEYLRYKYNIERDAEFYMNKLEYCEKCNCLREYEIKDEKYEIKFENKLVKYDGKKAVCKYCSYEVFSEEVEEYNQKAFERGVIKCTNSEQ